MNCYNESEAVTGFFTMTEDHLEIPFAAAVPGADVTVTGCELTERGKIVAVCARRRQRQRISICDLPLPPPMPSGEEWIEACRHWASND